jgi:hypothetical protein
MKCYAWLQNSWTEIKFRYSILSSPASYVTMSSKLALLMVSLVPRHHTVKMHRGTFFTSAVVGGKWSVLSSDRLTAAEGGHSSHRNGWVIDRELGRIICRVMSDGVMLLSVYTKVHQLVQKLLRGTDTFIYIGKYEQGNTTRLLDWFLGYLTTLFELHI